MKKRVLAGLLALTLAAQCCAAASAGDLIVEENDSVGEYYGTDAAADTGDGSRDGQITGIVVEEVLDETDTEPEAGISGGDAGASGSGIEDIGTADDGMTDAGTEEIKTEGIVIEGIEIEMAEPGAEQESESESMSEQESEPGTEQESEQESETGISLEEVPETEMESAAEEEYDAAANSGTFENLRWSLSAQGVLTVSGVGAMLGAYEDDTSNYPWEYARDTITEVVIEDGVTSISDGAFWECLSLKTVTIADTVTSIALDAFYFDVSLTTINWGNGLKTIGESAFNNCTSLTSLELPESVETIGSNAFDTCEKLEEVILGNRVQTIGESAFSLCESLTSITIPESVTSIGDWAFDTCTALETVRFKGNAPEMGEEVFLDDTLKAYYPSGNATWTDIVEQNKQYGAQELEWIPDDPGWTLEDGLLTIYSWSSECEEFASPQDIPWYKDRWQVQSIAVENGVEKIGDYAFHDCASVNSVWFEGGAPQISPNAFTGVEASAYCRSDALWADSEKQGYGGTLSWFTWGTEDAVLTISGEGELKDCKNLAKNVPWYKEKDTIEHVKLEEGITDVGAYIFASYPKLTYVTLPNGLESIGRYAFGGNAALKEIDFYGETPPHIFADAFGQVTADACIDTGEENWKSFLENQSEHQYGGDIVWSMMWWNLKDGVLTIRSDGTMAEFTNAESAPWYQYSSEITKIQVKDGVTMIGEYAFAECAQAAEASIARTVVLIGANAFSGCAGLTDVYYDAYEPRWNNICNLPHNSKFSSVTMHYNDFACGDRTNWALDGDTLRITGEGGIWDFAKDSSIECSIDYCGVAPWIYASQKRAAGIPLDNGTAVVDGEVQDSVILEINDEMPDAAGADSGAAEVTDAADTVSAAGAEGIQQEAAAPMESVVQEIGLADSGEPAKMASAADSEVQEIGLADDSESIGMESNGGYGTQENSLGSDSEMEETVLDSGYEMQAPDLSAENNVQEITAAAENVQGTSIASKVEIGEGVTALGEYMFSGDIGVTQVALPSTLYIFNQKAFSHCYNLQSFSVSDANQYYTAREGILYDITMVSLEQYPIGLENETFMIPDEVYEVQPYAFAGSRNLMLVSTPKEMTVIGQNSFAECTELKVLMFPGELEEIEYGAFPDSQQISLVCYGAYRRDWEEVKVGGNNGSFPTAEVEYAAFDPAMYQADYIVDDSLLGDRLTGIFNLETPSETIVRNGIDNKLDKLSNVWKRAVKDLGNFAFSAKVNVPPLEEKDIYRALLMGMFEEHIEQMPLMGVLQWESTKTVKQVTSVLDKISVEIWAMKFSEKSLELGDLAVDLKVKETVRNLATEVYQSSFIGKGTQFCGQLSAGLQFAKDWNSYCVYMQQCISVKLLGESMKALCRELQKEAGSTGNEPLQLALAEFINVVDGTVLDLTANIVTEGELVFAGGALKTAVSTVWGKKKITTYIANPWFASYEVAYAGATTLCELLFNTSSTAESFYKMYAVAEIGKLVERVYYNAEQRYQKERTSENAKMLISAVDLRFRYLDKDCATAISYAKAVEAGAIAKLLNLFDCSNADELRTIIEKRRSYYKSGRFDSTILWVSELNSDFPDQYDTYKYLLEEGWEKLVTSYNITPVAQGGGGGGGRSISASAVAQADSVGCPVDINIRNASGEIVAYIKGSEVYCREDEPISLMVYGGQKNIWFYTTAGYTLEYVGTGSGNVQIAVRKYVDESCEQVLLYRNVPLTQGQMYTSVENGGIAQPSDYIQNSEGEYIRPETGMTGEKGSQYTVTVENGYIDMILATAVQAECSAGRAVYLAAEIPAGYRFVRWESPNQISIFDEADTNAVFIMPPENVTVRAILEKLPEPPQTEDGSGTQPGGNTPDGNVPDTEHTHVWSEWTTAKEPTALAEGQSQRTCSCGGQETKTLAKLVSQPQLNMKKIPLQVKQSTKSLRVSGLAAGDRVVSYKTSNKKIASVSKTGKITAKKKGKASLTVTLASGKSVKATIVVQTGTVKTKTIKVASKKVTLSRGKNFAIGATLNPLTSQQKVTYQSSNKKTATVSSKGIIKARKKGKAVITVKSGSKSVKIKVTVK